MNKHEHQELYDRFDTLSTKEIFMMSKQYHNMSIDDKWFALKHEREILLDILIRRYRTCKINEDKELMDACYLIVKPIEKYWRYKQSHSKAKEIFGSSFDEVLDYVSSQAFVYAFNKYCTMRHYQTDEILRIFDPHGSGDWMDLEEGRNNRAVFTSLFWMNLDNYMKAHIKFYGSEKKARGVVHASLENEKNEEAHVYLNRPALNQAASGFKKPEEIFKICIMMIKKEKERRFLEMALEFGGDIKSSYLKKEFTKDFPMTKSQYHRFRDKVIGMVKAEFYNQRSKND